MVGWQSWMDPRQIPTRGVLGILSFFGFFTNYMLRVNLNIAIVEMTGAPNASSSLNANMVTSECINSVNKSFNENYQVTIRQQRYIKDVHIFRKFSGKSGRIWLGHKAAKLDFGVVLLELHSHHGAWGLSGRKVRRQAGVRRRQSGALHHGSRHPYRSQNERHRPYFCAVSAGSRSSEFTQISLTKLENCIL